MLRALGFALLLVMSAAVPAAANGGRPGENSGIAAPEGAATPRSEPVVQELPTSLQLMAGLQSPLRGTSLAGAGRELVALTPPLALRARERGESGGALALPWVSGGRSGLRLLVTERLSFAVGYRHLEGEDLWRRHAEAGSVDYDSHDFLLRAHWQF
jgi:hypothetical protein